jgi:hypothetical protein
VGSGVDSLAPRTEEITVLVEDDHGMLTSVEYVDVVLAVYPHCSAFLEGPTVWEFSPTLFYFVRVGT